VRNIPYPNDVTGKDPNDARFDLDYAAYIEAEAKRPAGEGTGGNGKDDAPVIDLKAWRASDMRGKEIPPREWIWDQWASAGVVTGLGGPPGAAKSLLAQQLCTHATVGMQYLGATMQKVPALHLTCEDDKNELDRRQARICDSMEIDLPDVMHLMSWVGEESLLIYVDNGLMHQTPRFKTLDEYIGDYGIRCVTMDLIPDFWNGNEIIRVHVNTFVKGHLAYLAQRHNAAIIPLYHPSKSGMADGSGTGGSTAWEGSFRGRIYIDKPDKEEITSPDRVIKRAKANYAALDEKDVTWKDGYLFSMEDPEAQPKNRDEKNLEIFLEILKYANEKDIAVSPSSNTSRYFGKLFPDLWKTIDGRHRSITKRSITKRSMEKAYLKALAEGLIEETERTNKESPRIRFIGYVEREKRAGDDAKKR
jgi:RecA-family ATPase